MFELKGIQWVIVGGESGAGARPMQKAWVETIQLQCRRARVPFFFKQWGGVRKSLSGRELNGRTYDEHPGVKEMAVPSLTERRELMSRFESVWPDESLNAKKSA